MLGGMTTPAPTPPPTIPTTFRALLELWPNLPAAAEDMHEPVGRVRKWYQRNMIPVRYWDGVLTAVFSRHRLVLTSAVMHDMTRQAVGEREVAA